MTPPEKTQKGAKTKQHKYFSDKGTEALIALIGGALIIFAMLAVTIR